MSDKPFFSVVVPTYNRAKYISFAIKSILNQTFSDFELVISNNNSSDETEEIVLDFNDQRIKYFKTAKTLPALENWEFALSKAQGKFITFIGDDDANSIATLELVNEALVKQPDCHLLGWQLCQYYWEDHNHFEDKVAKNSLVYAPFSGQLLKKDSRQVIEDVFINHGLITVNRNENILHHEFPWLVNAVYHHSIISDAKAMKYFFHPTCHTNDRYNAVISLYLAKQYFYLDYPLHLHGFSQQSSTATIESARKSFHNSPEEMITELECLTYRNYTVNSLLHAKADIGNDLDYIKIDWLRFFVETFNDLMIMKRQGTHIEDDLRNLELALSKQSKSFQEKFRASLPSKYRSAVDYVKYHTKNALRPKYRKFTSSYIGRAIRQKIDSPFYIYINGNDGNFSNISECSQMMSKDWLRNNRRL